jgi:hypothetical protein
MKKEAFVKFLKTHPSRKWRQTGGPPLILGPESKSSKARAKVKSERDAPQAIRQSRVTMIELVLPLKTVSEANQRDHWSDRHHRNNAQQQEVKTEWMRLAKGVKIYPPYVVKLTRIGPRLLDDDNLAGAFKHARDAIADILGIDDGSSLVRFEYAQIKERSRRYAVKIEIRGSSC